MTIRLRNISLLATFGLLLSALSLQPAMAKAEEDADPPSRVARLSFITGDVSFAPSGEDSWSEASLNRPLITGDRLLTDEGARIALDIGGSGEIRVAGDSGFNFLRLDDQGTQIELSKGTLNWRVDASGEDQNNEIDTPTLAFVITQPGAYRVDVEEDGATTISLLSGAGTVYGQGGASYPLSGRQSWRITDPGLQDVAGMPLASTDKFDRWCNERDDRQQRSTSAQYVSSDVIGSGDLDTYGDWDRADDYGPVWYPRTVAVGWAPYRYGHWGWIAPWGWTWIDDAPWGFAPFHYGRWVYVHERWGWTPGPRRERPVYCPALVAFVGGHGWSVGVSSGAPIGWVPLGPRDVYVPWYHGSRRYFTNVNVSNTTIINRTQVTNVYSNVQVNHINNVTYMHQGVPGATTVVTHQAFEQGRPVHDAQVRIDRDELAHARPLPRGELPAGHAGLGRPAAGERRDDAPSNVFTRPVVTHREPPPATLGNRRGPPPSATTIGTEPQRQRPAAGNGDADRPRDRAMPQDDAPPRRVKGPPPLDRRPQPVPPPDEMPSTHYGPRHDNPVAAPSPVQRGDTTLPSSMPNDQRTGVPQDDAPPRRVKGPPPLDRRPQSVPSPDELPSSRYVPRRDPPMATPAPVQRGDTTKPSSMPYHDGSEAPRPELPRPSPAPQPLPQRNPADDAQRQRPAQREEPRNAPVERVNPAAVPHPPSQKEHVPRPPREPEERERRQRERD